MNGRRGFTLVEIMIAIAIVGIMTVIATTNLFSWQSHYSSVDFQREFLSQVNEARTRSMATSLQHRLLIDMNTETVTLQRWNLGIGSLGGCGGAGRRIEGGGNQRRGLHSGRHGPGDLRPPF